MNKSRSIAICMETYDVGGPAKNMIQVCELLSDQYCFVVYTFLRNPMNDSAFIRALQEKGITVRVFKERFRYDPKALLQMKEAIQKDQPALVQVHNTKSRFYATLLKPFFSFLRLDCYHGETWVNQKQRVYNVLDRRLFTRADACVTVAHVQRDRLIKLGLNGSKVHVIGNGIEPACKPQYKWASTPFTFLSVGRLSFEKGHHILLEALSLLKKVTDWKCIMVGDGPEMGRLKKLAASLNLNKHIQWEGYVSDPIAFYQQADLFILPSLTEGIPNVLLEAANQGVPIITTKVGGVPEMFAESEVSMVAPGDAVVMAATIEELLRDPEKMQDMARSAYQRLIAQHSIQKRALSFDALYKKLLGADL